ncbi:MAG: efflux RND transporter periplasmic adaptor subunit [Saprospirales bacterium]|nr:MAG: efflux RND transporter periplasmic adaptor subunit [Saprospirales bacterium]
MEITHLLKSIVFLGLLGLLLSGCGDDPESPVTETGVTSDDDCLSESMIDRISIEEVTKQRMVRSLSLPGNIEVNKDRVFRVHPTASGIITDVHVRVGDRVQRGQVLATVQSPDIAAFKRDLRSARSERELAKRNLSLAESLFEGGVYSERDLLEAKKELERIDSELERLSEEQQVLGIEEDQKSYTIRAPESGFIVERNINPGTRLSPDEGHVFKISDLRNVWVVANVSESDIANIRIGDTVSIRTLAFQDRYFHGEIVRMSNTIDPNRRTMEAIVELPNPDFILKPGMFANIFLHAEDDEYYAQIPSRALIFDENEYYVVVYNSDCDQEIRKVEIRRRNGDNTYLKSGIIEGEKIISNRHILVYNRLAAQQ